MIPLQLADLVLIAGRVLDLDTDAVLDQMDVAAAEAALADATEGAQRSGDEPARTATTLIGALLRRRPLPHGNEQVALLAMAQFLALNGLRVDLDPPEKTRAVTADLAAGRLEVADLTAWLAPRLHLREEHEEHEEIVMQCDWRPSLLRWLPAPKRRRFKRDPFHRFTDRARTAVVVAQDEARRLKHNYIGTEHVLLGLIGVRSGVAGEALQLLGVTGEAVRREVEEIIGRGANTPTGHIPLTPRAKLVISECALREAFQLGHNYIGTEHLLLGLLREGQGVAAQVLVRLGASHTVIREHVRVLLPSHPGRGPRVRPHESRYLDEQIVRVRQSKEAAIDAGDFETAATLRGVEKQFLLRRYGNEPGDGPPEAAGASG